MSKWNKAHGLIVPIDSLLKEKENTNRPAPLRSAGLVGRWGITSFTSIRNTTYAYESTSPKETEPDLNCSSNLASLSTQVPNAPKPKKFFKSRNTLPPAPSAGSTPDAHRQQDAVYHHQHQTAAQLQARIAQHAGGSPPYPAPVGYYQQTSSKSPARAAGEKAAVKKEKIRKKKQKPPELTEGPVEREPHTEENNPAKKEKKEKKEKKPKKLKKEELPPELPKRNSSRIRNKVVNYNEDDDSFDTIPYQQDQLKTTPVPTDENSEHPVGGVNAPIVERNDVSVEEEEELEEPIPEPDDDEEDEEPCPELVTEADPPLPVGESVPELRLKLKEPKAAPMVVPVPLTSPSITEHPPIVLRISKGTSRLISTDSEDVNSPPHGTTNAQQLPPAPVAPVRQLTPPQSQPPPPPEEPTVPPLVLTTATAVPTIVTRSPPTPTVAPPTTTAAVPAEEPKKEDLKIKISLSKSALISNGGSGSSSGAKSKKESKKELRHFKKRVLAREKGRTSKRPKRSAEEKDSNDLDSADEDRQALELLGGVAEDLRVDPIVIPTSRPTFPLPGTDAYELYRTLASPSGGDDFDSQSSILGSASSNNTPKHGGLTAADDCHIIHSRGSSDCGSDLELSQNSSTAAAPPSEICFESENTLDNREEESKKDLPSAAADEKKEPPVREERVEVLKLSLKGTRTNTRATRSRMKNIQIEVVSKPEPVPVPAEITTPEPAVKKFGRATRNRNNNNNVVVAAKPNQISETEPTSPPPQPIREPSPPAPAPAQKVATRQYSRRKKNVIPPDYQQGVITSPTLETSAIHEESGPPPFTLSSESESALASMQSSLPASAGLDLSTTGASRTGRTSAGTNVQDENQPEPTDVYKIKNKFKRSYFRSEELAKQKQQLMQDIRPLGETPSNNTTVPAAAPASTLTVPPITIPIGNLQQQQQQDSQLQQQEHTPQPVKLVISKKKGSIFKSRPLTGSAEAADKKRHVYKHKWDDDDDGDGKDKGTAGETDAEKKAATFEGEPSGLSRVSSRLRNSGGNSSMDFEDDEFDDTDSKVRCDRNAKPYYTVIRNVKNAHQIQEIGESQEMDDDVEYILSALQPDTPNATRCLSAVTLASKCMTPAFRMHVRAHGIVTRFFKALRDAHLDQSLGLCTATILFVLSQDTLNVDLDRDSLELMLNLLDTDHLSSSDGGLTAAQLEKNKQKVREVCEEIKNSGKAKHMDLDNLTVGSLAMETLLSMTSKRAGDWFKDELRKLGGLDHLIKTVSDCCREISDYVVEWTDDLLSKLRKIERCLRVLENVTILNEQNQSYILNYNKGSLVHTLARLFKLVDSEVVLYPTDERTPKDDRGVVLREVIPPILKLFISLTHPFDETAYGAGVIGALPNVMETSLHLLLRVGEYVPQKFIFEMNILVLLLLINLTMYTQSNRRYLMVSRAPDDFNQTIEASRKGAQMAVQALVEYFYRQDELARYAEKNTDAILDAKSQKNEDLEETVTKLLQKAGHHMEHTLMASYVCLLIGWIVAGSEENETVVRTYLKDGNFLTMVSSLEKYYNFLNLTANSDALSLQHVRQTKNIIDNLKRLDAADREAASSSSSSLAQPAASTSSATNQQQSQPNRYGSRPATRAHY
ncbi:protein wings apart-like [Wyeomyia smithii]|uniref:protein wings apart-like n=1 Tax=Wyeomyia smithii TaxID=174621 RepID=UPI002467B90B|nr:protein wings apart-like [Wyeomyia smithii]XP_055543542.1 protein wings apart-like [Wyeomyia smithii]XP_055543547.1 protein wings apart-like [Wyeomyia smithii]XP_055543552.1 protein wings apart-like [Wyeomyia smithii]XP_055543555.1 protein wings apart-like [Wyeomyia smithii]